MLSNSVNTNPGAMIALQNLNKTNQDLEMVQNRINTGLKVASAKDNGGVYAIAQRMRADVRSYDVVSDSLDRGMSTLDVALSAGEAISDLLVTMKEKALAAVDSSLDTQSRVALNEDFKALRDQVANIVATAEFNGVNMINGSTNAYRALANENGTLTIAVSAQNMSLGGAIVTIAATASFNTAATASTQRAAVEASITNLNRSLAKMGTNAKALEIHSNFVTKLRDSLEAGIGNLVDADLAKESARLQAFQVKQQLGVQALSIANATPQTVLGFFR